MKWKPVLVTKKEFQQEMLSFLNVFLEYEPRQSLWDQTEFKRLLTEEDYFWIEENINKVAAGKGFQDAGLVFVVAKDVLVQMHIMDIFDKTPSVYQPKFFSTLENAIEWLDYKTKIDKNDTLVSNFNMTEQASGKIKLELECEPENIEKVLYLLKNVKHDSDFYLEHKKEYNELTNKEKQVVRALSFESSFKLVANELFVSEHTVRAHWRNIKKKLQIHNVSELNDYVRSFSRAD